MGVILHSVTVPSLGIQETKLSRKEKQSTMKFKWILLFAVAIATAQTTIAAASARKVGKVLRKAPVRENQDIDLTAITERIKAVETEVKGLKKAWMCQTGKAYCKSCGGKDEDFSHITYTKEVKVSFSPKFVTIPKVNMATSELWMQAGKDYDMWGFGQDVKDISATGFTAVLKQYDIKIINHHALWIACGKVQL